jgi:hypothetical protein
LIAQSGTANREPTMTLPPRSSYSAADALSVEVGSRPDIVRYRRPDACHADQRGEADYACGAGPWHSVHTPGMCLVIVDVLSFSTPITVAIEAGTRVFSYP